MKLNLLDNLADFNDRSRKVKKKKKYLEKCICSL